MKNTLQKKKISGIFFLRRQRLFKANAIVIYRSPCIWIQRFMHQFITVFTLLIQFPLNKNCWKNFFNYREKDLP